MMRYSTLIAVVLSLCGFSASAAPGAKESPKPSSDRLGERQEVIYLPRGLIVMSYLGSVADRRKRASNGFISFFVRRTPSG